MPLTANELYEMLADDFQFVDGIEQITFKPNDTTKPAVRGVKALRRALRRRDTGFGAPVVQEDSLTWHLWRSTMQGAEPTSGARITDCDRKVWLVQSSTWEAARTCWRCECTRLTIPAGLLELVTIEKRTHGKGASGQFTEFWTSFATNVKATIQITDIDPAIENELNYDRKSGKAYFETELNLTQDYRLVYGGETYQITGDENLDSVSGLYAVDIVQTPWPRVNG